MGETQHADLAPQTAVAQRKALWFFRTTGPVQRFWGILQSSPLGVFLSLPHAEKQFRSA